MKQAETFVTMSGAGNTFALFNALSSNKFFPAKEHRATRVAKLCQDLNVDGVLFMEGPSDNADYVWDFYNADGSFAEMCGNAARCAGLFCRSVLKDNKSRYAFSTGAGVVRVQAEPDGRWRVEMTRLSQGPTAKELSISSGKIHGWFVNTGVPHFVVPVENLGEISLNECRELRQHPAWGPSGSNITLMKKKNDQQATAKTYERGVEDFTAACGTGAVAAAVVLLGKKTGTAHIQMPGGDLDVETGPSSPQLIGPALILKEYSLTEETFR